MLVRSQEQDVNSAGTPPLCVSPAHPHTEGSLTHLKVKLRGEEAVTAAHY